MGFFHGNHGLETTRISTTRYVIHGIGYDMVIHFIRIYQSIFSLLIFFNLMHHLGQNVPRKDVVRSLKDSTFPYLVAHLNWKVGYCISP